MNSAIRAAKFLGPFVFLFWVAFLQSGAEAAPSDHRPELLALLRLIDQIPTKADLLRARITPQALRAAAQDRSLHRYPRARAAGLLGHFDRNETREWLGQLVERSDDLEVRLQALVSLTRLKGHASQPRLTRLLSHPHPELRAAAARGLVRIEAPGLARQIERHLQIEPVPWVRTALRRVVSRVPRGSTLPPRAPARTP